MPFEITELISLNIHRQVNHHMTAEGIAIIENVEQLSDINEMTDIIIQTTSKIGVVEPLFTGVISSISLCSEGELNKLKFVARSKTSLLDLKKKRWFFKRQHKHIRI